MTPQHPFNITLFAQGLVRSATARNLPDLAESLEDALAGGTPPEILLGLGGTLRAYRGECESLSDPASVAYVIALAKGALGS
jgi:hypothetical protein